MLSITEMAILGVGALLLFGPEQLPGMMKKAGRVMRDVQNTSHTFIREMERAADEFETPKFEMQRYEPPEPYTTPPTTEADVPPYRPEHSPGPGKPSPE
ncbi:MAG: twin-arginine translocase TatA/TatE family subunit [Candidatus Baltobacteraceae bacterium]